MRVVIIGGSLAGLRTAEALRRNGFGGKIVVLEASNDLPYDRPPLSKEFLLSEPAPNIELISEEALRGLGTDWRLGWKAERVDLAANKVYAADGSSEEFDRLVIATGSHPRRLPGFTEAGCIDLRSLDDAITLRTRLESSQTVGVIGGGFIGTEIAATARARGLEVSLIEAMPSLLLRGLPGMGFLVERLHRKHGVDVIVNAGRVEVEPSSCGTRVVMPDGVRHEFDLVVSGIGCVPSTGWLVDSGLVLDDGIVCDANMQALHAPGVFAAGDIARWYHPLYERTIRLEHWSSAQEHAEVIARTICGEPVRCEAVPFVWSEQFGHRIQVAGLVTEDVRLHVLTHDEETDRCVAIYEKDGLAMAAITIDEPRAFGKLRRMLAKGMGFDEMVQAVL